MALSPKTARTLNKQNTSTTNCTAIGQTYTECLSALLISVDVSSVLLLIPFGTNYPPLSGSPTHWTFKRRLKTHLTSLTTRNV